MSGQVEARRRNSEQLVEEASSIARRLEENRAAWAEVASACRKSRRSLCRVATKSSRLDEQDRAVQEELAASRAFLLVSERECLEARARFSAGPMSWGPCATGSTPMAWRSIASGEIVAIGSEDVYENWAPPTRRVGAHELPPISGGAEVDLDLLQERIQKLRPGEPWGL